MKKEIVLFEEKKDCSGCGACMNKCPKGAISMQEDEYGFVYPVINQDLCVKCGACVKVCGLHNHDELVEPKQVFALASNNSEALKKSASGGAFMAMARYILKAGGVVFGVELTEIDGVLSPRHIDITSEDELEKLQGSKYVQSDTGSIYKEIQEYAKNGKLVLFSGTPCQNASLRKYLGTDYPNVVLVDIICHGVPNKRLFGDFIKYRQNKLGSKIDAFYFRDKEYGQGYTTKTVYTEGERKKSNVCKGEIFAYIRFFSKSLTLRESCYCCPFANRKRISDITIGDFWGFNEEKFDNKSGLNDEKGVSCVLVNSEKGCELIQKLEGEIIRIESEYEKVLKHNKQLNKPTQRPSEREMVLEVYRNEGYAGLEKLYSKKWIKDKIKYSIINIMPTSLKNTIKKTIR